jgi:hypothetical protein
MCSLFIFIMPGTWIEHVSVVSRYICRTFAKHLHYYCRVAKRLQNFANHLRSVSTAHLPRVTTADPWCKRCAQQGDVTFRPLSVISSGGRFYSWSNIGLGSRVTSLPTVSCVPIRGLLLNKVSGFREGEGDPVLLNQVPYSAVSGTLCIPSLDVLWYPLSL